MSARVSPVKILAAGTSWRLFGSRRAGEALLDALSDGDEQSQMLAGMSLVKAGQRSFDLIEDRIEAGQASPAHVRLLADIDSRRARTVLEKIVDGKPGEMADAARQCMELLDRIDSLDAEAP